MVTPAYTTDNLHLNDAGGTLVAAVGATKLAAIAAIGYATEAAHIVANYGSYLP